MILGYKVRLTHEASKVDEIIRQRQSNKYARLGAIMSVGVLVLGSYE